MKKILLSFIALFFVLSNFSHAAADFQQTKSEQFYDFFSGTIIKKNDTLYLHTCQTVDVAFKLSFNHPKDEHHIRQLMKKHKTFWLNLSADAEMENDQYLMTVDSIYEEHLDQSCHLSDILDELE